jgi:hypothetical protein
MMRIAEYQAILALRLLPTARDVGDNAVVTALVNIRQGWLLGRRVARTDWALADCFDDAMREAAAA